MANPVNDMYADAVLAVILQVESNPTAAQGDLQSRNTAEVLPENAIHFNLSFSEMAFSYLLCFSVCKRY